MKNLEYVKPSDAPPIFHFFGDKGRILDSGGDIGGQKLPGAMLKFMLESPSWIDFGRFYQPIFFKFSDTGKHFSINMRGCVSHSNCEGWTVDAEDIETAFRAIFTLRTILGIDNSQLYLETKTRTIPRVDNRTILRVDNFQVCLDGLELHGNDRD